MSNPHTEANDWAASNRRNTVNLAYWTSAWLVTMAAVNFGPKFIWSANDLLTLLAILINLGFGFGMIWANKRQLQGLDELHQRIQLEAMGITLGVGLVVGLAYSNLDTANIIPFDAEISHLVILMGLTYLAGTVVGLRRYQ